MDWIAATCWAVIALAGLWALWALFWDRPRGRLRCRKCAYDMAGVGLTCPECGKTHASERALRRTRRRWKSGILSLFILVFAGYGQANLDRIHREGPAGMLPSVALVLVCNPESYLNRDYSKTNPLVDAIDSRLSRSSLPRYAEWLLASRISSIMERDCNRQDLHVEIHDLKPIAPRLAEFHSRTSHVIDIMCFGSYGNQKAINYASVFLETSTVKSGLEFFRQLYFNEVPAACFVGELLILKACRSEHDAVRAGIAQIPHNTWSPGQKYHVPLGPDSGYIMTYNVKPLLYGDEWGRYDQLQEIETAFERTLVTENERSPTTKAFQSEIGHGAILVFASSKTHQAIVDYLESLTPP